MVEYMPSVSKTIVVVGSLNADLVQAVTRLPRPGETLAGSDLQMFPGGKGANQACAAARMGCHVSMIGEVGRDGFGDRLLHSLNACGVDTASVARRARTTGTALIFVLPGGENAIAIAPGANSELTAENVAERLSGFEPGWLLLCQLEVPVAATARAMQIARQAGGTTILDPAPAQPLSSDLLRFVDILTPNQMEAAMLLGGSGASIDTIADAQNAAAALRNQGARTVVVKMGSLGCVWASADGAGVTSGFAVAAVDTTAAGDVFNGALAAALAEGKPLPDATYFANAAAALSVTRPGAQSSIPDRAEVDRFLRSVAANTAV